MSDRVYTAFLESQVRDAAALAAESDLVGVVPFGSDSPPFRYLVELRCKGLVCVEGDRIEEVDRFVVGIYFPPDYLRRIDPATVVTLCEPLHTWHPNVQQMAICCGRMRPGAALVEIIDQAHKILSYQHMGLADPLNPRAAAWARAQPRGRFPIDARPLRRRPLSLSIEKLG